MARKRGRSVSDVARYTGGHRPARPPFGTEEVAEPPISSVAFWFTVVATTLILILLAVTFGIARIESDLESRVSGALSTAGYPDVVAEAFGTSIHLTGSITTDQTPDGAILTASSVRGVSSVQGAIWPVFTGDSVEIVVTGDELEIRWISGFAVVSGSISTPEKKAFVDDALTRTFPGGVAVGNLMPLEGLADESPWLGTTIGHAQRFASKLEQV